MAIIKGLEWTFDTQAEAYGRMRPPYAAQLYEDIFDAIKLDGNSEAIEIGIGGGQATLPILQTGCKVTAVEYGKTLSALCRDKFRDYPNFSVVNCKFEDFECDNGSVDFIYSASAFHWIEEQTGYTKVFDLLKSGGVFARFANHPYKDSGREQLWAAVQKLYAVYMPGNKAPDEYTERQARERAEIALKYGFTDVKHFLYRGTRSFTAEQYVELLHTYSDHIALEESVRNEFFGKVRRTIDDFGGQITLYDTMDLQLARKP